MIETLIWRRIGVMAALIGALGASAGAAADQPGKHAPRSALDGQLFYQLLIGEMELRNGQPGAAFQVFMDAARRTKDPLLFRRAIDVALQSRAGNEALEATRAWRSAQPDSVDALRLQLQILTTMGKLDEMAEPMRAMIELTAADKRDGLIAALPHLLERAADKKQAARLVEEVLSPEIAAPASRAAALVSVGRLWLAAGDSAKALALAQQAAEADPKAPGPVLLSIELIQSSPEAERIVLARLARPGAELPLRLAYVRLLMARQRYADAIAQLKIATTEQPEHAPPFLTLGALYLELRQLVEAESTLQRYLALAQPQTLAPAASPASAPAEGHPPISDADDDERHDQGIVQAWLMLAQSAELRGDFKASEDWLARIDDPRRALDVQSRRASLIARQGRVDEALALLRRLPEPNPHDARAKLMAEVQLLRDVKRWSDAFDLLGAAAERASEDVDLLYQQAMVAERMNRLDVMERLLRRVMELKPDHAHAHNALGYSLADRGLELAQARSLIQRALGLLPGDPFITDSLGWVEFRLGNREDALRLLRLAWAARPDTEIAAHLGEVLWTLGRRDEALAIWRQAKGRDKDNELLLETLIRLQVKL